MFVAVTALLLAFVTTAGHASALRPPSAAPGTVPHPAAAQSDRIGVYHWGPDPVAWPGSPDQLTWGANTVTGLGARTIRVAIDTADPYGVNNGATTLPAIAQQRAYRALFSSPSFDVYLLTAYTANDMNSTWAKGYGSSQQIAEKNEIAALGTYLLQTFSHKTFIILNWEGDNALSSYASSDTTAWNGFVSWTNARIGGVVNARKAVRSSTSSIFSGLEFNAVKTLASGALCDTGTNKCVISYVAPKVSADYYSYSSWQSLGTDTPTSDIATRLTSDLTTAYHFIVAARPSLTPGNFLVGEFGAAREISGECDSAARASAVVGAIESWGASYGIFWQAYDNAPSSGVYDGFGLYKRNDALSLTGQTFRNLYTTGSATVPAATCGLINVGGVVNGITYSHVIHPGDIISIFGSNFSGSGNTVWLKQGSTFYPVTGGSPNWYESPAQINGTLPAGVVAGSNVDVYVNTANGLDSNGQLINVVP
jgi:hypothetical protein